MTAKSYLDYERKLYSVRESLLKHFIVDFTQASLLAKEWLSLTYEDKRFLNLEDFALQKGVKKKKDSQARRIAV
jgi:hypothetical protein